MSLEKNEKLKEIAGKVDIFIKESMKSMDGFIDIKIVAFNGIMMIVGIRKNGDEIFLQSVRSFNGEDY